MKLFENIRGLEVMNNVFEILKLDNKIYDFIIIATSYENPLNYIKEIGKEIQVQKANLLFDLTLINGINKNRYIKCAYDVDTNQLPLCSIVECVDDDIKKVIKSYFYKNEEVIKRSIISTPLKYLLISDMV